VNVDTQVLKGLAVNLVGVHVNVEPVDDDDYPKGAEEARDMGKVVIGKAKGMTAAVRKRLILLKQQRLGPGKPKGSMDNLIPFIIDRVIKTFRVTVRNVAIRVDRKEILQMKEVKQGSRSGKVVKRERKCNTSFNVAVQSVTVAPTPSRSILGVNRITIEVAGVSVWVSAYMDDKLRQRSFLVYPLDVAVNLAVPSVRHLLSPADVPERVLKRAGVRVNVGKVKLGVNPAVVQPLLRLLEYMGGYGKIVKSCNISRVLTEVRNQRTYQRTYQVHSSNEHMCAAHSRCRMRRASTWSTTAS
jgi:hypothetical protein